MFKETILQVALVCLTLLCALVAIAFAYLCANIFMPAVAAFTGADQMIPQKFFLLGFQIFVWLRTAAYLLTSAMQLPRQLKQCSNN